MTRPTALVSALVSALVMALVSAVATGCGGRAETADAGTDSGPGTDGGGGDAARDDDGGGVDAAPADAGGADAAPSDGSGSPCAYVETIDRSCAVDGDCLVRIHQADCCGSTIAIGIHGSAAAEYASRESECQASHPLCDCPARAPTTDSGETFFDTDAVEVACVAEGPRTVCRTYVTMRPEGTP